MTPYLLEGKKPLPAMIICPGGAYMARAYHEGEPVAKWLNSIGISAFVLNYRISPCQHPAPLEDAQRAIRIVRENANLWNVDPNRVGIIGFSAGGHLAAIAGTRCDGGDPDSEDLVERQSSRPDLMVLGYPVITMDDDFTSRGSRTALLGNCQDDAGLQELLSAHKQITASTPPAFLWHTVEDTGVPIENSLLFASGLRKYGIPFALHLFEGGVHGLGLADDHLESRHWTTLCEEWLKHRRFISNRTEFGNHSTLDELLTHQGARRILDHFLPGLLQSPHIDHARGFTLTMLSGFPESPVTSEVLQAILSELASLPAME